MQNKGLFFFLLIFVLSSCASNSINVKPDAEEYLQLANTPVYVKRSSDTDLYTFENELDECIKISNNRANRSSKVGIGFGSYLALGGLYTIATASGVFAPIYVAAGTLGGVLGGSTIFVTNATKEFREYSGLEKCLEKKEHDVIFYEAKKAKE
tara:strand:- start:94 stop:552 length:459 start_codon:yes stop_codon:yes gene_type:complete